MTIPQNPESPLESPDGIPPQTAPTPQSPPKPEGGKGATVTAVIIAILGVPCLWNAFLSPEDVMMGINVAIFAVGLVCGFKGTSGRYRAPAIISSIFNCIWLAMALMCTILSIQSHALK